MAQYWVTTHTLKNKSVLLHKTSQYQLQSPKAKSDNDLSFFANRTFYCSVLSKPLHFLRRQSWNQEGSCVKLGFPRLQKCLIKGCFWTSRKFGNMETRRVSAPFFFFTLMSTVAWIPVLWHLSHLRQEDGFVSPTLSPEGSHKALNGMKIERWQMHTKRPPQANELILNPDASTVKSLLAGLGSDYSSFLWI